MRRIALQIGGIPRKLKGPLRWQSREGPQLGMHPSEGIIPHNNLEKKNLVFPYDTHWISWRKHDRKCLNKQNTFKAVILGGNITVNLPNTKNIC